MEKLKTNPERLMLLACNPKKPYWLISKQILNMGLSGALMLDLVEKEHIGFDEKYVIAKSRPGGLTLAHENVWKIINQREKNRKAKRWITYLANRAKMFREPLFKLMQDQGMLHLAQHSFLFIPYLRISVSDNTAREKLIAGLTQKINSTEPLSPFDAGLLSVILAMKLFKPFTQGMRERKTFRQKLKKRVEENPVADGIQEAIQEMQAAITAATVAAVATTSASAGN